MISKFYLLSPTHMSSTILTSFLSILKEDVFLFSKTNPHPLLSLEPQPLAEPSINSFFQSTMSPFLLVTSLHSINMFNSSIPYFKKKFLNSTYPTSCDPFFP